MTTEHVLIEGYEFILRTISAPTPADACRDVPQAVRPSVTSSPSFRGVDGAMPRGG